MLYARAYIGAMCALLLVDSIWLGLLADEFYRQQIGHLLAAGPRLAAAAAFYVIYVAGIVIMVIRPALAARRWRTAAAYGAVLGFTAYATYDLTNYATLRDWPITMVVVDLIWGTLLTSLSATVGYFAARPR